jgi:hypothetical protein
LNDLCVCSVARNQQAARSEVRAVDVGLGYMQVRCKWLAGTGGIP